MMQHASEIYASKDKTDTRIWGHKLINQHTPKYSKTVHVKIFGRQDFKKLSSYDLLHSENLKGCLP